MLGIYALMAVAAGASPAHSYMVQGVGTRSCGTWTNEHRQQDFTSLAEAKMSDAWVGGFITAYNYVGPDKSGDIGAGTDFPGMIAWIGNYCASNPLDTLGDAAEALVNQLYRRKSH